MFLHHATRRPARPLLALRRASPLLALCLAILPACTFIGPGAGDAGIAFASTPPGARILIDGKDSGFVTPCRLALDPGDAYKVELRLQGYVPAKIRLTSDSRADAILWSDMYIREGVWNFPLWLNLKDTFQPFSYEKTLAPARVYARLERAADP
jgi:hypothetical protein